MPERPALASDAWTAAEWEARRAHAADYLARHADWVVGPAVVAMYAAGRDRARAREAVVCPAP